MVQVEEHKKHQEHKSKITLCLGKNQRSANINGTSVKVKGKVYRACIQSVLRYASETLAMSVEDMAR